MSRASKREAEGLRDEIKDLTAYLEGLPEELRQGGAFAPYEARLDELKRELALAELRELKLSAGR
ncbi:MAG TPA: hypothetical protein VE685_14465 [Thermoanaerobaculia bacterium]|nr:hypothetical protein [Thermoanaerobaculia bacterium]